MANITNAQLIITEDSAKKNSKMCCECQGILYSL